MLTLQYRGQTYSRNDAPVEQLHYDRTTFETFETRQNHARPVRQLTYRVSPTRLKTHCRVRHTVNTVIEVWPIAAN